MSVQLLLQLLTQCRPRRRANGILHVPAAQCWASWMHHEINRSTQCEMMGVVGPRRLTSQGSVSHTWSHYTPSASLSGVGQNWEAVQYKEVPARTVEGDKNLPMHSRGMTDPASIKPHILGSMDCWAGGLHIFNINLLYTKEPPVKCL